MANIKLTSAMLNLNLQTDAVVGLGNLMPTEHLLAKPLVGGPGNDGLEGTPGADWIDGGPGADTMVGGDGDDTYIIDDAGDRVIEAVDGGVDLIRSSITIVLPENVEQLVLMEGAALDGIGNAGNNVLTGNRRNNRLEGLDGNDTLDGGPGRDTLVGGAGADLFRVDVSDDIIIETGTDSDTVEATVDFSLPVGVETLILLNSARNGNGNDNDNVLVGNDQDNILDGKVGRDDMSGGAGHDTYLVDNRDDVVRERSNEGMDRVIATVSTYLSDHVEYLTLVGTGDLNGTGNAGDNQIDGNPGNNRLDGNPGADTLIGGAGDDTYVVDNSKDIVLEGFNAGSDTVETTMSSYTLPVNIENLLFVSSDISDTNSRSGTGNALDNSLSGTEGKNDLRGLAGNDVLYGMGGMDRLFGGGGDDLLDGGSDADRMEGGSGNDTYWVDQTSDLVIEAVNAGTDTVFSPISWSLGPNQENLRLLFSYADSRNGIGNELNNILTGNDTDNLLDGGAGADTMVGGQGWDTYIIDNSGDEIRELPAQGWDEVRSFLSMSLGANLEKLTLLGTDAIKGSGNEEDNVLIGNTAANQLEGLLGNDTLDGGSGRDTLVGGMGADLYRIDSEDDVILETGKDIDTVEASCNFILGNKLENLVLTGTASRGSGNSSDNIITGNSASNTLYGAGGKDELVGGKGNDTYIVDDNDDLIKEMRGGGYDRVLSSVSHTLALNVEQLILRGSGDINGIGNSGPNGIVGNLGDNVIDGSGGADTMEGGSGDDTYIVEDDRDVVIEMVNNGNDWIFSVRPTYTLPQNVENLQLFIDWDNVSARDGVGNALNNQLLGTGGSNLLYGVGGNDTLIGSSGSDTLYGGDGNDVLDGGADPDRMEGGAGDDVYFVADDQDQIIEAMNNGVDTVVAERSWTLGENIENLRLRSSSYYNIGKGNDLNNVLIGGQGDDDLDGGFGVDTMIGGAGLDTYTIDNAKDVVQEDEGTGPDLVQSYITYTLGSNLERLTLMGRAAINGSGNGDDNLITGNEANNRLEGFAGFDTLYGAGGVDTLVGGMGSDTYWVDSTDDIIVETGLDWDKVSASTDYVLPIHLEELKLDGQAVRGTGNEVDNRLEGNGLNNILDGGAGADTMYGGYGDDTYVVDNFQDLAFENLDEGHDTILSSISLSLSFSIEDLILTGSRNISGTGNTFDNLMIGNGGDNELAGAIGSDTMIGGSGNDTYWVDDGADVVIEEVNDGIDRVGSFLENIILPDNVENLLILFAASASPRNGTGNRLNNGLIGSDDRNQLFGLSGDDTLQGQAGADSLYGGSGHDVLDGGSDQDLLEGGDGNDRYIVDQTTDVVRETLHGGADTVESSVSWTLGLNVENLTLTGSGASSGNGNSLNNRMQGNSADNILNGGAGADTLIGGSGNDTYVLDDSKDLVQEFPAGGIDKVRSFVSCILPAFVEDLRLLGNQKLMATGNSSANRIIGNSANNLIVGGMGQDRLTGQGGADIFRFDRLADSGSTADMADLITDFTIAQGDQIDVSGVDAISRTTDNEAFAYIGSSLFTAAGQIRSFVAQNNTTYIELNTDSDLNSVELLIVCTGELALNQGSFIL